MTTRTNFRKRQEQRRADAIGRQIAYNESTTQSKIELCKSRRGESKKELHHLHHGRKR